MAFAELLERAGGVGLFQALQVLTLLLPSILLPSQTLIENFLAAVPGHRCWVRMLDNSSKAPANLSSKDLLTVSIPPGLNLEPHQCRRFHQPQWQLLDPNATATNWSEAATEPCMDGWVYDHSTFTSTIVSEWDLVCDNQGLKPMGQSIYMAGVLLGSVSWGFLSDWFGRKPVLSWCCLQVALANTGIIFASNFLIYCGLRFLSAFGVAGIIMIPVTLMVEWTTTRRRAITVTVLGCSYSLGQMALGALAFTLRDWRALQTAVSMPFFVIFLISWWLPESARWLIITGKPEQALQELRKVARINGHKEATTSLTVEVLTASMEEEVASVKARRSVLDLFLMPTLRWRSCSMFLVRSAWCRECGGGHSFKTFKASSALPGAPLHPLLFRSQAGKLLTCFSQMISYYGLVLDLQNLGSDIFLLQVLFGAVDLLGRATTTFLLSFLGHRMTLASFQAMAGLSILANIFVPQDLQTVRVVFAVLGKGCFGISLTSISVYKSELYPTTLRMTADGFLQSVGRLGAVMGPLVRMTRQAVPLLAPVSYGVIPIMSSLILLFFLPETGGLPLPDTIQDLENQRSAATKGKRQEVVVTESTWF
ncbi:solute carrier family 22 member 11 isoform X1 [Enhydra lutris kenyoni]|uniref:Solute carrier family 22 member 11 isoform X1 n=1 Tax=Enhydra lutris kenyoni TaxID=391180 RepID=A0A2Y9JR90_ENHLU|nr:solute carrier family 22 member 11 isoform X1 [Enhydra lutris kenyoni]